MAVFTSSEGEVRRPVIAWGCAGHAYVGGADGKVSIAANVEGFQRVEHAVIPTQLVPGGGWFAKCKTTRLISPVIAWAVSPLTGQLVPLALEYFNVADAERAWGSDTGFVVFHHDEAPWPT